MKIKMKDEEDTPKNVMKFEIEGEDHTFANLLVDTLQDMKEVKIAQYDVKHPRISSPDIYLETKKSKKPKEILKKASEEIEETMKDLKKQIE